jgi:hypothetical protein
MMMRVKGILFHTRTNLNLHHRRSLISGGLIVAFKNNGRFEQAIEEMREHLQINRNPDATDSDAYLELAEECGQDRSGYCSMAGSEYCDWECPFSK